MSRKPSVEALCRYLKAHGGGIHVGGYGSQRYVSLVPLADALLKAQADAARYRAAYEGNGWGLLEKMEREGFPGYPEVE